MAEVFLNWGWPIWLAYFVAAAIQCALLIHVLAVGALIFIWMERKVSGRIQDRLGPTRVGGKFGWLQTAGVVTAYELATIGTMVALVLPASAAAAKLSASWLNRFGDATAGGIIVAVGVLVAAVGW